MSFKKELKEEGEREAVVCVFIVLYVLKEKKNNEPAEDIKCEI